MLNRVNLNKVGLHSVDACLGSATKKVRKVDIRSALRTFQIFRYAFGTHLTQKVHILFVSDSNADII